jgi:hypothetical protein
MFWGEFGYICKWTDDKRIVISNCKREQANFRMTIKKTTNKSLINKFQ